MNCPLCSAEEVTPCYENKVIPFQFSNQSFDMTICYCNACSFVFQSSAYGSKDYADLMEDSYRCYRKPNNFVFPNRKPDNVVAVDMITDYCNGRLATILEIGSNRGDLLFLLKEKNTTISILGIEPTLFENLQVPTIRAFFDKNLLSSTFDVIILQQVLEHLVNPCSFLNDLSSALSPGGLVYIEVPNLVEILKYSLEDFVPEHVSFFTTYSLINLLHRTGFSIVSIMVDSQIRIIASRDRVNNKQIGEKLSNALLREGFSRFSENSYVITRHIAELAKSGHNIIFYGVSYYYFYLYKRLMKLIDKNNCFFYDDNYDGDYEETYGLRKAAEFNNAVVIVCSTVLSVQEKIRDLVIDRGIKGYVLPWREIKILY